MFMKKNFESNLFNLLFVIVGVVLFISAQTIKTGVTTTSIGGAFLPKIVTGLWLVTSILLFVFGLKSTADESPEQMNKKGVIVTFILFVFYIGMINILGFVICSIIYLVFQILLFMPTELRNKRNYILVGAISLVVPILTNLIFVNAFSLIMPAGRIF